MDLQITKSTNGNVTIIALVGKLDAQTAPAANDELKTLIFAGKSKIILDMKDLTYISSAGLGILNSNQAEARKKGGAIRLAGVKPSVKDVFDLLKFTLLFQMFPGVAEAQKDF